MGRDRRPDLPGGVFHLTARTLRYQRLFVPPLRTAALDIIARAAPRAGMRLLAVAVMPNHLHLVVQQGKQSLFRLMQPILRRLAHHVQRHHDLDGPVFWRPYGCQPCLDPEHARNAIVYVHLNPVRAGLTDDPGDYRWSSHHLYRVEQATDQPAVPLELVPLAQALDPGVALPLFADGSNRTPELLRRDYQRYVEWRLAIDRLDDDRLDDDGSREAALASSAPIRAPLGWGELRWGRTLSPLFHPPVKPVGRSGRQCSRPALDLAQIARATLASEAPELPLAMVRGRRGGARCSHIRHLIIVGAHAAGYQNVAIARFLCLSESAVSKVICSATSK